AFLKVAGPDQRLVITGGSSATDKYVQELKSLAAPAGDRILFTGAVYGERKEQLLTNARLFLLPSALEGLPITLLEAMAHGTAWLVSDMPPHRDVIVEGENGFLHSADSFEHLCDQLRDALRIEAARLAEIAEAGHKTVGTNYDWESVVDSVERFY